MPGGLGSATPNCVWKGMRQADPLALLLAVLSSLRCLGRPAEVLLSAKMSAENLLYTQSCLASSSFHQLTIWGDRTKVNGARLCQHSPMGGYGDSSLTMCAASAPRKFSSTYGHPCFRLGLEQVTDRDCRRLCGLATYSRLLGDPFQTCQCSDMQHIWSGRRSA